MVITQILLLALGLTLSDVLFLASGQRIYAILIPLFLLMGGLYLALLYKVLEVHAVHRTFKLTCFWLLSAVLIASVLVENPFYKPFEAYQRTYVLLGIHISIFLIELLVIVLSLKLVLSKNSLSMMTRLWATCSVYF